MVPWVNIRIIECPIKSHVAHQPLNCLHPESYILYGFQGSSCGFHMSGVQNPGDIRLHWLNQTDPYTGFICSLCSRLGSLTLQSPPPYIDTHTHTKHNYNIGHCHCPFFFGAYPLEVQPPLFIGWFPNHHFFSRGLSSSKRNHHFFNGGWLPGYLHILE